MREQALAPHTKAKAKGGDGYFDTISKSVMFSWRSCV